MKQWNEIKTEILDKEAEIRKLQAELEKLQSKCSHLLPKRNLNEDYIDICPKCGYVSYCYGIL